MAFNGSGTFNRVYNWVTDKANAIKILAARMDTEMDGFATGLSTCVTKDGQTNPTADLPMNGFKHTGVGAPSARNHYATVGVIQDHTNTWCSTSGGTANAQTLTPSPAITAYTAGQSFEFIAGATNTAAATLAVSGLTTKAIQKNGVALVANDMLASATYKVTYDGAQFQLINHPTFAHGADIASATTLDLSTSTGDLIDVTGTTNITAITLAEGKIRTLRFTGILTLTNGASLVLPGAADIVTAAGDIAIIRGYASGVVRVASFQRLNGTPVGGASYKIVTFTRDTTVATGSQAVTGVGFKPKAIIFLAGFTTGGNTASSSWGYSDLNSHVSWYNFATAFVFNASGSACVNIAIDNSNKQTANLSSFDADGFTLAWTKTGTPTGTGTINALCLR